MGSAKFTVTDHDGHNATVTSETAGSFTMPKDSVKHFVDDLNQRVDVPEHPSNHQVNAIREGRAEWIGKGDDGLVFDIGDGSVGKVTTTVPYNLQNHRQHHHAIADAKRQADLTNQAISEGHDILLPQEFIEHGEKGFTFMPKVEIGGDLTAEQIKEYRAKLKAFHDAGWRVNDRIQHGVDADGRIRIFDTGKLQKIDPTSSAAQHDDWQQATHGRTLMREHGHFDEELHSDNLRNYVDDFREVLEYNDGVEQNERVNPLYPHQWRELEASIDELIENESEELGFHVDDLREAFDRIEGQFPRITPRGPAFTAKTNDPNADFWIQRKGGENTVGTPHKDFRPESIGITVDSEQLLPDYAYYLFQHIQQNLGFWKQRAKGTLNLKNITLQDVKELQQQVGVDEPAVPQGFELIEGLRNKLDKYESETVNRILDRRLLDAQSVFADMITDYEQYDEDDLPHDESLDAYIYDKDLFAQFIPDLDADELAALAFASYRSGVYRDEDTLKLAGFLVEPEELSYNAENGEALRNILQKQNEAGLNGQGEPLKPGEETADGGKYEPMTDRFTDQDADEFMRNQYPEGYSWGESGFLLNDGTLLDMSHGSGTRADDHRAIIPSEEAAAQWGFTPDGQGEDGNPNGFSQWARLQELLYRARAIRIDGNAGLINAQQMPTTQQWQSIAQWIEDFDPDYAAITLGDTEWDVDYPTVGLLMRQFDAVADGINPGDEGWPGDEFEDEADQYAAFDDDEYPSTETQSSYPSRLGSGQMLEPQDKRERRQFDYSKTQMRDQVLVQPEDLEPYEHVEPEQPKAPESNPESMEQLKKHYKNAMGEDATETSSIKQILLRNKDFVSRDLDPIDPRTIGFTSDQKNYLANLDQEEIERLHDEAHPKAQKINAWENDDYYYHIAPSANAELIADEGLKSNLETNFPQARANVKGNVFFTEKEGAPEWARLIGDRAYHEMQLSLEHHLGFQKRLLERQQRSNNLEGAAKTETALQQTRQRIDELENASDDHIASGVVKVFRVPKSKITDYVATDEMGSEDAKAPAYKLNAYTQKQIRRAKEQVGTIERDASNAQKQLKEIDQFRQESIQKTERMRAATIKRINEYSQWHNNTAWPERRRNQPEDLRNPYAFEYTVRKEFNPDTDSWTKIAQLSFMDTVRDDDWQFKRQRKTVGSVVLPEGFIDSRKAMAKQSGLVFYDGKDESVITWLRERLGIASDSNIPRSDDAAHNRWFADTWEKWKESSEQENWTELEGLANSLILEMRHAMDLAEDGVSVKRAEINLAALVANIEAINSQSKNDIIKRSVKKLDDAYNATLEYIDQATTDRMQEISVQDDRKKALTTIATSQLADMKLKAASNPNYWRWAKNTKALDNNGMPVILFHGTSAGGFGELDNLDVDGHVYASPDVSVGASYNGGYRDDVTPALANTVEDVQDALANTRRYRLEVENDEDGDRYELKEREEVKGESMDYYDFTKTLFRADSDEELIVKWNYWLFNQKRPTEHLNQRGVYPLLYRLQNPAVIYGEHRNWDDIPFYEDSVDPDDAQEVLGNDMVNAYVIANMSQGFTYLYDNKRLPTATNYDALDQVNGFLGSTWRKADEILDAQYPAILEKINPDKPFDPFDFEEIARLVGDRLGNPRSGGMGGTLQEGYGMLFGAEGGLTTRQWAGIAEALNHDGIIFQSITDYGATPDDYNSDRAHDVYVAFSTDQVKSAHNFGQFSEQEEAKRLLYQAMGN